MDAAFPVDTKQDSTIVNESQTTVTSLGYANYIVILISQCSNFGSLIKLTMDSKLRRQRPKYQFEDEFSDSEDPQVAEILPHSTTFLFGNPASSQRGMLYNIIVSRIGQVIFGANLEESRPVLIGISLKPDFVSKGSEFDDSQLEQSRIIVNAVTKMVEKCKVW